ncbi:hypothetical protein E4665_17800 [Sporolactobacillus shoreae]|uniref:AP2/ERF domain-containing protein n=1 Tax=Sporolactobacillus shoreae TaxID=1465501 RepID=A0A4Z0GII7_9BACL|nr:HNH endonuclease [Sporolactobacillus shoreae]TGA95627.1 hypothetical protein E4665_17800 [Sporolactobacillus shoreae]
MAGKCSYCGSTHRVARFRGGNLFCLKHYLQMRTYGKCFDGSKPRQRKNSIILKDDYTVIVTANGDKVLVDNPIVPKIINPSWCISKTGYVVANINHKVVKMHRLILKCSDDKVVDHINGNRLDNRLKNLRICSAKNNSRNKGVGKNNSSGVPGVSKTPNGKWRARIMVDRKEIALGRYEDFEKAVQARKQAEIKYFGKYGRIASREV